MMGLPRRAARGAAQELALRRQAAEEAALVNWSAQTWPVRSTAKACVTDTILCCAAMVAGSHTTSMGWKQNSGLRSIRSYSRRGPSRSW
jgi:hypothetical protein